jgi:signal peptidase I
MIKIKRRKKNKTFWYEFFDIIISAALIALVIKSAFIEVAMIPSSSMEDTLMIKDKLFVDKFMYGISIPFTKIKIHLMEKRKPKIEEIVVFIPPSYAMSDKPLFVKRCVGIPGDKIKIINNTLYRNNKPIEEPYLKFDPRRREYFKNWPFQEPSYYTVNTKKVNIRDHLPKNWAPKNEIYTVPKGYYLMMGDHRTDSYDSRFWGPVPYKKIIGIVRFRWFPFHRIGIIK